MERFGWRCVVAASVVATVGILGACSRDATADQVAQKDVTFTLVFTDYRTEMFPCGLQSLDPNGGTAGTGEGQVRFSLQDGAGSTTGSAVVTGFEDGGKYCVGHVTLPVSGPEPYRLVAEVVTNRVVESGPMFSLKDLENADYQ